MKLLQSLKSVPKKVYAAALVTLMAAAIATPFAVKAATAANPWGPERPTYDYANGTSLGSMNGPVFNSFTNAPSYGDERNFATVSADGKADWKKNIDVTPGQTIQIRAYVHNDANSGTNGTNFDGIGVAHNTRVRFYIPSGQAKGFDVAAYVSANNATPGRVYDTALVQNNGQAVSLSYVPGSAKLYNYATYANGVSLPDSVVGNDGALIGYNALDGNLPGCFDYRASVIISVKVNAPQLQFSKQVTTPGSTDWKSAQHAKTGDTISWLLSYKNAGTDSMKNVTVRDILPKDLSIVPGTVTLVNTNNPNGKVLPDDVLNGGGANSGEYLAGAGGYIRFRTKVADKPSTCNIVNTAYAKADNVPEQTGSASVIVDNCEQPKTPTYACNLLEVATSDGRNVELKKFEAPAANGASFTNAVIDWNDGSEKLTTNNVIGQKHTYAKDGTYKITATAHFKVDGKDQVAASESCAKTVTFSSTTPPTVTPPTTTTLPNTGMGATSIAITAIAASVLGTVAHMIVRRRRSSAQLY